MERTVFRFVILLLDWLALSPAAVAQIPCDQYLAPMFASPHFLPTPDSTVGRYNAIAKRDGDTDAHNYRVTIYSVRLAEKEGLSNRAIQGLIKGAFLHDMGKIGIRDDVLLKPGKLTDEEYEVMKTHVGHGLDIVGRSRWLEDALAIVGSHHEKFGGGGYPAQVPGELIPTTARIFAITDVFDALSSERPYKKAMSLDQIVTILEEGRGHHFDPDLLTSFLEIAPGLHAHLVELDIHALRDEMHAINSRYFASGLEAVLA